MNSELKELLDLRNDVDFQKDFQNYVYCYSGGEIKLLLDHISMLEDKINTSDSRNEKISNMLSNKEITKMTKGEIEQLIDLLSKQEFIYALIIAKGYEDIFNSKLKATKFIENSNYKDVDHFSPIHIDMALKELKGGLNETIRVQE